MNCKIYVVYIFFSGVNSSIQQQDTKVLDNMNYKNQDSMMNTMNKYNDDVIYSYLYPYIESSNTAESPE